MDFQDRSIQCIDCNQDFVFSAGEQEFYDRKGFKEVPKRCKSCRDKRKTRRDGGDMDDHGNRAAGGGDGGRGGNGGHVSNGDGGRGGSAGGRRGGGGNERELFDANCAACGAAARVPFRPVAGRPVYCRECYANRSIGNG